MEGMVQQDGSSYILGDQSTHHRGSITSPEFPVTGDLLFIPNGEAWTGATWKNNLIISVTFKYTDASGDEQTEVVTQELLIDKNGRPYNLNFQRPEGVPENATMYVNLKVEGTGHNIVSPGTFELTAHELVIDENSEVNTDRLALNVGRNIRLRVIRSFSNTKFYTLSLPFQFSQQWADRLSLQRFCGYCHI
jgi:hypothetical protein